MNNTLLYIGIGISLISVIIFFLKDKLGDKTRLYLSGSLGVIAVGLIIASLLVTPSQTVSNYHHNKKNMRIHLTIETVYRKESYCLIRRNLKNLKKK